MQRSEGARGRDLGSALQTGRVDLLRLIAEGTGLALLGVFVHRHAWFVGDVPLPWGAALVVAAVSLRCRVVRAQQGTGSGAAALALSWLLATSVAGAARSGDTVIAGDALGTGYVLGGALVVGVCATWPSASERKRWAARRR